MKKIISFLTLVSLFPLSAGAQGSVTDFKSLMQLFLNLLATFMSLLYAAAFATFFWGIVQYIFNTDDPTARQKGTQWMVWSVVALFVMVTLWGIIGLLVRTFGITPTVIPQLGQ
jgi:uncharacterized membrane protein